MSFRVAGVGSTPGSSRGLVGKVGAAPRYSGRRFTEPAPLRKLLDPLAFADRSDPMPDLGGGSAMPRTSLKSSAWAKGPGAHMVVERERGVLQQLFDRSTATSSGDAFCVKSVYRIWRLFDPHMEGHMSFPNFLSAVSCDEEACALITKLLGGELPAACGVDCKARIAAWKSCYVQLVKFAQGLRTPDEEKCASSVSSATRDMSDRSDSGMESGSDTGKSTCESPRMEVDDDVRMRSASKRYVDFEDFVKACQERQLLVMPATTVGRATMTLEALQEQRRLSLAAHAGSGGLLDSVL